MKPAQLAWRLVSADRRRLALYTASVGFAVLIVQLQLGFKEAVLDSFVQIVDALDADLVLLSADTDSIDFPGPLPRVRLYQALAAPGAREAGFVLSEVFPFKNPEAGTDREIRVLGLDPASPGVTLAPVLARASQLAVPGTALMDRRSRESHFGPAIARDVEVASMSLRVIDTFVLGTDIVTDGNLIVGEETYYRLLGVARKDLMTLGLLRLERDADVPAASRFLSTTLLPDTVVLTKAALRERERAYWDQRSPVSPVFGLGTVIGAVVGISILYQLLFTLISDQLPQLATLAAMGYPRRFQLALVLCASGALSLLGYAGGTLVALALYALLEGVTGLPFTFGFARAAGTLALALLMSTAAGLAALRRVLALDPADLY